MTAVLGAEALLLGVGDPVGGAHRQVDAGRRRRRDDESRKNRLLHEHVVPMIEGVSKATETIGAILGALVGLFLMFVTVSSSLGVVREYCLNVPASEAAHTVVVDKHWTYIAWPPVMFSAVDPPGRCVRNLPLRQALDAVGIWKLPSPEEQVRRHIAEQLKASQRGGQTTPSAHGQTTQTIPSAHGQTAQRTISAHDQADLKHMHDLTSSFGQLEGKIAADTSSGSSKFRSLSQYIQAEKPRIDTLNSTAHQFRLAVGSFDDTHVTALYTPVAKAMEQEGSDWALLLNTVIQGDRTGMQKAYGRVGQDEQHINNVVLQQQPKIRAYARQFVG
jgi:hypothetical protein